MKRTGCSVSGPIQVRVAVPVGRSVWVSKQATLYYEDSRLLKADGVDLAPAGPHGASGILYLIKDCLCRDNRRLMRLERHKIVDGNVVDVQNWGEIEDASPSSTLAAETDPGSFSPQALVSSS